MDRAYIIDVGRDEATGKRKQKWSSGFPTGKAAETAMREELGERDRGTYTEPTKLTVGELAKAWLKIGAPGRKSNNGLKPSTLAGYGEIVRRYISPAIGNVQAVKLTTKHVSDLYSDLEAKGLSSRTVTYTATVLKACLGYYVREGKLARNVAEGQRLPYQKPVRDSRERVWTAKQRRQFLDGCRENPLFAAFYLAAHTGLRRGEVCGLRWRDIDFEAGTATIQVNRVLVPQLCEEAACPVRQKRTGKAKTMEHYHVQIVDTTPKRHRARIVDLDPATVEVLQAHRIRQLANIPGDAAPVDVFTDWQGGRLSPDTLSYRFELAVKASGLPYISLHSLRHTWATLALQAGVPVQVVSEMLGHQNVNVTWNVYQHVIPSMRAEAAAKVAAL